MLARICAGAAVASAAAAVAFAAWVITLPRAETLFFAPSPFDAESFVAGCGCLGLVWAVTGAVLVAVRPRNALGWMVLGVGVSQAWAVGLTAYGWGYGLRGSVPAWPAYLGHALYLPGWLAAPTLLLALYPDGRLPGPRWRWPVAAAGVSIVALAACVPIPIVGPAEAHGWTTVPAFPERLNDVPLPTEPMYGTRTFVLAVSDATTPVAPQWWPQWTSVGGRVFKSLLLVSTLVIWLGTVVRLVRARPPRRQQLAWLVCVVMPFLAASLLAPVGFANVLVLVSLLLVPVAVAVGVLRYRLLGIEAVLRRGLVYGMFTAAVLAATLVITAVVGTVLDRRPLPGVVVAALVAVSLAPLRDRLQRAADRLVYGERRDPLRAVTLLGERMAATADLDLLPGALASVMTAVHAPGAAVATPDGRIVARLGTDPAAGAGAAVLPLWFGGQQVGELRVAARRAGESYPPADARLLAALALQVAVVVRAFELTEALEAERDRVLAATRTERDRLRADMHDGLGPSLSGVGLGLQALADHLDSAGAGAPGGNGTAAVRAGAPAAAPTGTMPAAVLLGRMREEVATAVAEVRRIIDGLRPSALDTMGLATAIRRHAETVSASVPVQVVAADLPPLPPQVENAAYRITTEALANAARHAGARRLQVELSDADGMLRITVADDGHGVGGAAAGIGLTSMRRRAETLGGQLEIDSGAAGTTVIATLPLEQQ